MKAPQDTQARARLWQALGYQPGVGVWFTVWSLARTHKTAPVSDTARRDAAQRCPAPRQA